jgi:phosphatidylserine/phosphatidylglycerophosphate/cardiolipin synthase-like enzyme
MSLKQLFTVSFFLFQLFNFSVTADVPKDKLYNNEKGSPLMGFIKAARKSIDIEIYQMADKAFIAELGKALDRKVKIRIIKEPEPLGDNCKLFGDETTAMANDPACKLQMDLKKRILSSGGSFVAFDKKDLCADPQSYCYLHGKMVIADDAAAMLSTGNFNSTSLCDLAENPSRCDRDFSYVTFDDKNVKTLTAVFERDLMQSKYDLDALLKSDGNTALTVSPLALKPIVNLIASAKKSIILENQYLKEKEMNQALIDAAKRGVDVQILTASVCSFGAPKEQDKKETTDIYTQFDAAGIKSKMFSEKITVKGKKGYLHAKVMTIDGVTGWVGSINGSKTALTNNREYGIIFNDLNLVKQLEADIKKDLSNPGTETWQESLSCLKDSH